MTDKLSARLSAETKEVHDQVSRAAVVAKIVRKTIKLVEYEKLLARYYHMYAALEEEVQKHKNHEIVKHVYFPQLNRLQSIEADLHYYLGEKWSTLPVVVEAKEATEAFCKHMAKLSKESPELLVAHMYVRYLGDLAGGQLIGNKLRSCFEGETLPDKAGDADAGVKFYVFYEVADPKATVAEFRKGLDSIQAGDGTEELREKIIDEAVVSFELNGDILSQLE